MDKSSEDSEGSKLFIGNLAYGCTEDELRAVFEEETDQIIFVDVLKGYGFVKVKTRKDAEKLKLSMNKRDVKGRSINVELANPKNKSSNKKKRLNNKANFEKKKSEKTEDQGWVKVKNYGSKTKERKSGYGSKDKTKFRSKKGKDNYYSPQNDYKKSNNNTNNNKTMKDNNNKSLTNGASKGSPKAFGNKNRKNMFANGGKKVFKKSNKNKKQKVPFVRAERFWPKAPTWVDSTGAIPFLKNGVGEADINTNYQNNEEYDEGYVESNDIKTTKTTKKKTRSRNKNRNKKNNNDTNANNNNSSNKKNNSNNNNSTNKKNNGNNNSKKSESKSAGNGSKEKKELASKKKANIEKKVKDEKKIEEKVGGEKKIVSTKVTVKKGKKVMKRIQNINQMTDEMIIKLFSYLNHPSSVVKCSFVCKRWSKLSKDSSVWKVLCSRLSTNSKFDNNDSVDWKAEFVKGYNTSPLKFSSSVNAVEGLIANVFYTPQLAHDNFRNLKPISTVNFSDFKNYFVETAGSGISDIREEFPHPIDSWPVDKKVIEFLTSGSCLNCGSDSPLFLIFFKLAQIGSSVQLQVELECKRCKTFSVLSK